MKNTRKRYSKPERKAPDSVDRIDSLEDMQTQELSGAKVNEARTSDSDTDEHLNEGSGDGKLGRMTPDILEK